MLYTLLGIVKPVVLGDVVEGYSGVPISDLVKLLVCYVYYSYFTVSAD